MAILDSKGRLFGKFSLLDIGAVLVILLALLGIILPGTSGVAQVGATMKPVEFDIFVRGLDLQNPKAPDPQAPMKVGDKVSLVIRNQPFGDVAVKNIMKMPRTVTVPQPDGSVKALPDPRPEASFNADFLVTLTGDARMTPNGPVLGGNKIKAGTKIEIEGPDYNYPDLVVQDVRIQE
jgi:hypothetical protein